MKPMHVLVAAQVISFVLLIVVALLLAQRVDTRHTNGRLDTCQRVKLDRQDAAKAFRADSIVLQKVVDAAIEAGKTPDPSLVHAARINRRVAASFRSRLLECEPLVRERRSIPDEAARADALAVP